MHSELEAAMAAIESIAPDLSLPASVERAALAGLGSKYLALGSPTSLGLLSCGSDASALRRCHEILFGELALRSAGGNQLDDAKASGSFTLEEAFACDIVCLSTSLEFEDIWIADATHLNIVDTGEWTKGMHSLARRAHFTYVGTPRHALAHSHGSMEQVISGSVSGRMGEELTVLLWTPSGDATP